MKENSNTKRIRTKEERMKDFEIVERMASKSKLTQKDADEIADLINSEVAKKLNIK